MPKRRRDPYNPYRIRKEEDKYYVQFKDSCHVDQCIEVSEEIFKSFDDFEKKDLSPMNEYDRHTEHSVLTEESLWRRGAMYVPTLEERVEGEIMMQKLHEVLNALPDVQRQRWIKYRAHGLSYTAIAESEGCGRQAVTRSVECAEKKIRDALKDQWIK